MVLWLDFVICLCYVCSLDRLLSCMGARRGAAKVAHTAPPHSTPTQHPHTAPHSLDSF